MEPGDALGQSAPAIDIVAESDSTTPEESTPSSRGTTSEVDQEALKLDALKQYSKRFGVDLSGQESTFNREQFEWRKVTSRDHEADNQVDQILEDFARDMKVENCSPKLMADDVSSSQSTDDEDHALKLTFGYAGDLDENPPFAKFDIRDHVCMKVGGFKHGQVVRDRNGHELVVVGVRTADGTPRLWFHPKSLGRPGAGAYRGGTLSSLRTRVTLVPDKHEALREMRLEEFDGGDCSDDEEVILCRHCHLPIGAQSYLHRDSRNSPVHGECMATLMSNRIVQEQERRKEDDDKTKMKIREDYDIGWRPQEVRSNVAPATMLGVTPAPEGMCCLVFNETTHSIAVAPTLEPAESMNLDYLSTALKVRSMEGREPLFSLDPLENNYIEKDTMQEKRFEPEWLAGTSVGEVLFQADYHLKELSFGEYDQPVVGMKSCADWMEASGEYEDEWSAREWFVVKKAEVQITDANVLVPRVKMGVEAREQVFVDGFYEDKPVTRRNHPMVKYADEFTRYFDLIAERKSVIFHLRELAKASVIAKMLIENSVNMHGPWLFLAEERKEISSMEVPQLWNKRECNHIEVQANVVSQPAEKNKAWGMYGGVNFGLQSQSISMPSVISRSRQGLSGRTGLSAVGAGLSAVSVGRATAARVGAMPAASLVTTASSAVAAPLRAPVGLTSVVSPGLPTLITGRPTFSETSSLLQKLSNRVGVQVPFTPAAGPYMPIDPARYAIKEDPRGVDLNLDEFNFSKLNRAEGHNWDDANNVKRIPMGNAFWASVDDDSSDVWQNRDKALLRAVFDPTMCDRRQERDNFVPPDTSYEYVKRLRNFIKAEADIRKMRRDHFCSINFSTASPGPLFPRSFQALVEIAHAKANKNNNLHLRPDYTAQARKFDNFLRSATPNFDKTSEDGTRFRIYSVGQLEVRTTQDTAADEIVAAVFSKVAAPIQRQPTANISDGDKISKVTEYVEKFNNTRHSYTVLETQTGSIIVTEKQRDGNILWEEDPADLEHRNSLARIIRSTDCPDEVAIKTIKGYQAKHCWESSRFGSTSSRSADCKRYAQGVYCEAAGQRTGTLSGFAKPQPGAAKWRLSDSQYGIHASSSPDTAPAFADGKRPTTGDMVEIKESGRIGKITFDDHTAMPYKVKFDDGESPSNKWYKECDVRWT